MIRSRLSVALILVFSLAFAATAFARPQYCEEACTPTTPDNILCTCNRSGLPVTTCGEWRETWCGLMLLPPSDQQTAVLDESAEASSDVVENQAVEETLDTEDGMCWAVP